MSIIHQVTYAILEALLNSLWQSVLLVAVAICILYILRNRNAATRYLILWIILLILAFIPFVEISLRISKIINPIYTISSIDVPNPGADANGYFPHFGPINIPIPFPLKILPSLILCLWAIITIFTLSRLLKSYFYTTRLKKSLSAISPERKIFREFFEANGLKRKVALYAPSNVRMPMAIGLFKPVILIPDGLMDKLTDEQLKQVIFHELAHIRRWDDWTNLIQKIIETFFFWHPIVLYIARRLDLEREIACDDWVVTLSGETKSYALCLTKLIEFNMFTSNQPIAIGVALRRKHITTRISMLLSKGRNTNPNFSLYDILTSVFTTILAFVIFAKISPTLALVGQQSDIFKPITAIENIFIREPVVNQKPKLSPPTQEVINNLATQNKTEEKVKRAYNINSIKTYPKVIDVPQETIRPSDSMLSKPLGVESDKTRTKTVDTPRDIETPAKNYEPAFLHNIEDQSKALRSEESKNDINKPDNKPGRARELLTNVKDSSQKAISIVGAVADDKSEKIERKVTNTFVEFGGSLKDSANKLCDKAGSGKDSVKNRVGGLYSSLKRRIN